MKRHQKQTLPILWAPWRKNYILRAAKMKNCVLCKACGENNNRKNLIVRRNSHAFAILNLYPYNNGHIMVVPNRHVNQFDKLKDNELLGLMKLQNEIIVLLEERLKPHGFNVGVNLGRVGGAGIIGHIHIHILPRWLGDTNFMPLIAKTKVISESLASLYTRLTT